MSASKLFFGLALATGLTSAVAHEGHDHAAPLPADASWAPRVDARSNDFDLVAAVDGGQLVLWLDRAADNAPVAGASIEVEAGAWKGVAQPAADGSYRVADAAALAAPGRHELVFSVQAGGVVDLLPATLEVPAPVAVAPRSPLPVAGVAAGGLVLAGGVAWLAARRKKGNER